MKKLEFYVGGVDQNGIPEPLTKKLIEAVIASHECDSYSIFEGTGYWKGEQEPTFKIEIIGNMRNTEIDLIASSLKGALNQEAVLVVESDVSMYIV